MEWRPGNHIRPTVVLKPLTGSLVEKYGAKLIIKRQDDDNQSQTELIKFANDYKKYIDGGSQDKIYL